MMHILYSFPYRMGKTGVGVTAWQHVRWLSQLGVKLTVLCGSLERPLPASITVRTGIPTGALKIPFRVFGPLLAPRLHDLWVARHIERALLHIDLIHGWPLGSEKTLAVASSKGIVTVLENCNSHMQNIVSLVGNEYELLRLGKKPRYVTDRRWLARHIREYGLADYLACPSAFVRQSFINRGFPEQKLLSLQYGYDDESVQTGDQDKRHDFKVVFLGRGEPRKGLHHLLTAWINADLPSYASLSIAGFVEPAYMKLLEALLKHTSVTFLGYVNNPSDLLRGSHVVVLPSIEEGSALVSYEARGAGCVILASTASGALGQDGEGVLFHRPGDTGTIKAQLEMLANHHDEYKRIRERGLNITSTLTWKHAAYKLRESYANILKERRSACFSTPSTTDATAAASQATSR